MFIDDSDKFTEVHLVEMGRRMDQAIRLAKKNKSEVAGIMGISRAAMTQYCNGESTPSLPNMTKFCLAVKASMDYIVTGTTPDLDEQLPLILGDVIARRKKVKA